MKNCLAKKRKKSYKTERSYSFEVDLWALGASLFFMRFNRHAFEGDSPNEIYLKTRSMQYVVPSDTNCHRGIITLLENLLTHACLRWKAQQVKDYIARVLGTN